MWIYKVPIVWAIITVALLALLAKVRTDKTSQCSSLGNYSKDTKNTRTGKFCLGLELVLKTRMIRDGDFTKFLNQEFNIKNP